MKKVIKKTEKNASEFQKKSFRPERLKVLFLCMVLIFSYGAVYVHAQTATIEANTIQQNIRGFGAANIIGWRNDLTAADRITAFSVDHGLGLSVLRVRVSPNSGDWIMNKPSIDAAKANGAYVIASAWSAPASMKTNGNTTQGNLKTSSYADYATHLRNFCETVGGVDAISPINEPNITVSYESMEMSASEIAAFVAAQGQNCGAPIMAPEPFNMSNSYIQDYLSNSSARSKTTYIAGHIYGTSPAKRDYGKEIWMTEHIVDSNTNGNDWNKTMTVAKEIHDCMNAGYSMYVWWYVKRFYGPIEEDGIITKTGYIMSHFSKFVRPGFNKIGGTSNPQSGVYVTAYKKGSKLVIVTVNEKSSSVNQSFSLNGISASGFSSYKTTSSDNLVADNFFVSGNNFNVSLPASSITTLVSFDGSEPPPIRTPTPTPTPVVTPTPAVNQNPYNRIEAESYIGMYGIQVEASSQGGESIGYIEANDYTSYSLNFTAGASRIEVSVASDTAGGTIEVRLGSASGTLLGTVNSGNTGGWQVWQTVSGNISNVSGKQTVYLVYKGSSGYLLNIDWLKFTPSSTITNCGDVNNNGSVDIIDALMTAQYYVGLNPTGFNPENANVNGDNSINIIDALMIAQYYVGLLPSLEC